MSKNIRYLIIGAVVLLVVVGGILALTLLPQPNETTEPSPSPSTVETKPITDETAANVSSIELTYADGEVFTIASDVTGYKVKSVNDVLGYDGQKLTTTFLQAVSLATTELVEAGATNERLGEFGISAPTVKVRLNRVDGSSLDFVIGKKNVTDSGYYAALSNSSDVYLISLGNGVNISRPATDYLDLTLMPEYEDINPNTQAAYTFPEKVNSMTLSKEDTVIYEIGKYTADEMASKTEFMVYNSFYMTKPFNAECNDSVVQKNIAEKVFGWAPSEIVGTADQDLAKYGLDKPYILKLGDENGWSKTILVGGQNEDKSGRYLMVEGSRYVMLDTTGDYSTVLEPDVYYMRSSLVWLIDIKNVSKVEYTYGDITRTQLLDVSTDTTLATLDGKEMSEDNAKRLYQIALSVSIYGGNTENNFTTKDYSVTITSRTGIKRTLDLYYINDRQYQLFLDGENLGVYCNADAAARIRRACEMIDRGESIPFNTSLV